MARLTETVRETIGSNVRTYRQLRGIEQSTLARRMQSLGLAWRQVTVSEVERKERNVTVPELFGPALSLDTADAADPPKTAEAGRPESITWTADQLRTFLEGTRGSRHWPAYLLLATTGLRRGECLGLRWSDLDLDGARASIRQTVIAVKHTAMLGTPKTAKGRRTVTLDAGTVAALREHRKRQAAERLLMGAGWTDTNLVFCHVDGTMLHPERFTRGFSNAIHRLGLPPIRLHDLRHGWATLALQAGVHPKIVQERLGHANIGITLDTYSHVVAGLHEDAAEQVAALFRSPVSNPLAGTT